MLYTTTLIVTEKDKQFEDMGVDSAQTKYYPVQLYIEDIKMHHAYEHTTDDNEVVDGTILFMDDGFQIAVLENFNTIENLRKKYELE